jgi:uncharacterized protein YukE
VPSPFDPALAARAADACERAAARLAAARREQAGAATAARDGWEGPAADRFTGRQATVLARVEAVERSLHRLAGALQDAAREQARA